MESDNKKEIAPPEIVKPKIMQTAIHLSQEDNIILKRGQVWVVVLDASGIERPGSGFITTQHTFDTSYDKTKFKIKKKA